MMKYLSILFACMVMALSTMPCFLMHCSTCPGCTQPETVAFGMPVERVTVRETIVYADSPVSSYHPSIWQPPRA